MTARLTLTYAELAEALGVSDKHIANQVKKGRIKAIHLGARRLIPMAEVERLLKEAS